MNANHHPIIAKEIDERRKFLVDPDVNERGSLGHEISELNERLFPGDLVVDVSEQGMETVKRLDAVGEPGAPLRRLGLFPIADREWVFGGGLQLAEFGFQVRQGREETKVLALSAISARSASFLRGELGMKSNS
ncbi:MAG: hypothetical protein QNL33_14950 [Akkermansiaceae bacterium]